MLRSPQWQSILRDGAMQEIAHEFFKMSGQSLGPALQRRLRFGVLKVVDCDERICQVDWIGICNYDGSREIVGEDARKESAAAAGTPHALPLGMCEVSCYELLEHPEYTYSIGDVVVRLQKEDITWSSLDIGTNSEHEDVQAPGESEDDGGGENDGWETTSEHTDDGGEDEGNDDEENEEWRDPDDEPGAGAAGSDGGAPAGAASALGLEPEEEGDDADAGPAARAAKVAGAGAGGEGMEQAAGGSGAGAAQKTRKSKLREAWVGELLALRSGKLQVGTGGEGGEEWMDQCGGVGTPSRRERGIVCDMRHSMIPFDPCAVPCVISFDMCAALCVTCAICDGARGAAAAIK
jgi:hypothetical protein